MITTGRAARPAASGKTFSEEAAPLLGRKRIAHAIGRSPRTVSRWIKKGILPPMRSGPFKNSLLLLDGADLERISRGDQGEGMA
jgi:hypothetical protein